MEEFELNLLRKCGSYVDDRGVLTYLNNFDFANKLKRFYLVENHEKGFVRAWHGHEKEEKYVVPVSGIIKVGLIKLDSVDDESAPILVYMLSSSHPNILHIPAGFANGFQTLTDDAKIMFFSTSTLEESKNDDIRFPWDKWNIWKKDYR